MISPASLQESSLLLTLEEISQLVSHSHHPGETLANIVRLVQGHFPTDVCSVYLLEADRGELVLGATVGLKADSVGRVRMRLDEGLTGLVAEQMTPVMVDDAFQHPRFKYFPEAGEDPYHSFLGVPLIESGTLQGVLVVQTLEPRHFAPNEIRMLVTVGSQLASLVSEAHLLERIVAASREEVGTAAPVSSFQGVCLSPGTGLGEAYVLDDFPSQPTPGELASGDGLHEPERLHQAMAAAREEITRLSQRIGALVGEDHGAILQAQLMIMQDRTIEQDLTQCLTSGSTAEGALRKTLQKYVAAFQKLNRPFFQERAFDLKDVFRRILWHLRPHPTATAAGSERLVLVAREASVMDLFSVDLDRLAGVVVGQGGPQSHAAILARSLGIPMVGQVGEWDRIPSGRPLLVDAGAGLITLDPPVELKASLPLSLKAAAVAAPVVQGEPRTLTVGPRVEANINLLYEVDQAVEQQVGGVGLYRTEFLFLARRTLPTEEEQVGVYRKLLSRLTGRPASIRTFDWRPDKVANGPMLSGASGAPLDWRLVLESPPLRKLFKDQVRAILRTAAVGPARILVPWVTRAELLDFVLQTVEQARAELRREGLEHGRRVPVGIMIEVAAAAFLVEAWAERVDFFALGTNDLLASALGLDRDHPVGASRNDMLHPGVLRMLRDVVAAAHRAGRLVSVCGEMAADPGGVLALAALKVDSLSVPVNQLAPVREVLAGQTPESLAELERRLTLFRTADQAREFLRARSQEAGIRSQESVQKGKPPRH